MFFSLTKKLLYLLTILKIALENYNVFTRCEITTFFNLQKSPPSITIHKEQSTTVHPLFSITYIKITHLKKKKNSILSFYIDSNLSSIFKII